MTSFTDADVTLVAQALDAEVWTSDLAAARAVLTALADAGRLTPPGAEVREELARGSRWTDATCAACGRNIRVWDASGPRARVLLDPDPTDDGDTIIQSDGQPIAVHREDVVGRFVLYRSHFFTCPNRLIVPRVEADGTP